MCLCVGSSAHVNYLLSSFSLMHESSEFGRQLQRRLDALAADRELAAANVVRTPQQRVTFAAMVLVTLVVLLANLVLLILTTIGASECLTAAANAAAAAVAHGHAISSTSTMDRIRDAVCDMESTARYGVIVMTSVNVATFMAASASLSHACCQLRLGVHGWRGVTLGGYSFGHLIATCLLAGWVYTQGLTSSLLVGIHCAGATLLLSTLIVVVCAATTLYSHYQPSCDLDSDSDTTGTTKRSHRGSFDIECAHHDTSSTVTCHGRDSPSSLSRFSLSSNSVLGSSNRRGRFSMDQSPLPTNASGIAATGTGLQPRGMSVSEIRQIATQVVPCRTPASLTNATTRESIRMACCAQAPVLPTMAAVGLTSPRGPHDQGPVVDLVDAAPTSSPSHTLTSPAAVQWHLNVPKHLHLNTASPMSATAANSTTNADGFDGGGGVDAQHANTPLAMHAAPGSALQAILMHGPLAGDASCELCRDLFQAHQLVKLLPRCGHALHSTCLVAYVKQRRDCPRCHTDIISARPDDEKRHGELAARRQGITPTSNNHAAATMRGSPHPFPYHHHLHTTPMSMREAIAAGLAPSAMTPRQSLYGGASHLSVLTSPPSASSMSSSLSLGLSVDPLSSGGILGSSGGFGSARAFEYRLDSVKLTPAGPTMRDHAAGQLQQRHHATTPHAATAAAATNASGARYASVGDGATTSPNLARSSPSAASPTSMHSNDTASANTPRIPKQPKDQ